MYKGKKERSVNVKGGVGGCRMFELRAISLLADTHKHSTHKQRELE